MHLETQTDGFVWPDPACLPPGHSPYSREHARKRGYVAQIDLQGETERDSFYRLEGEFYNEYRPTCATESALLDEVFINYWRMQRVRELQSSTLNDESANPKLLALYFRYRTNFEGSEDRLRNRSEGSGPSNHTLPRQHREQIPAACDVL